MDKAVRAVDGRAFVAWLVLEEYVELAAFADGTLTFVRSGATGTRGPVADGEGE